MLDRLIYRIKQLWFALFAAMNDEDRLFVSQYLDIKEAAIFFGLPDFEQKHAVVVAHKMVSEAKGMKDIDQRKLIRLGLLHDIGKSAVRLSIFDKAALVILHKFINPLYNYLAGCGEKEKSMHVFRQFYVHKHHGTIGAKILKRIGVSDDIANEVAQHDRPFSSHDIYMKLLDRADSSY